MGQFETPRLPCFELHSLDPTYLYQNYRVYEFNLSFQVQNIVNRSFQFDRFGNAPPFLNGRVKCSCLWAMYNVNNAYLSRKLLICNHIEIMSTTLWN